jgi:thioredoxin reductase (NADPH)
MINPTQQQAGQDEMAAHDFLNQLRTAFSNMSHPIHLYLFTDKGRDDVFCQTARQVVRAFREITDKIIFREHDIGHELARKWDVEQSPTLLFEPERYNIRWLGAPLGEEARIFIEALLLIGMGDSNLSEQSLKALEGLGSPRQVKVFVSASCPYCPQQATNTIRAAVARPDLISLEIIDIQCNPELTNQYSAHSVPQTFANEVNIAMGAQPEELFIMSLIKLEQVTVFIPESTAELVKCDLLIVGGGPAGLTAGIYGKRSGLETVIIERDALGGQIATTPVVENYPGLTQVGGKSLVDIMVAHALEYVQIFQGEEVIDIQLGHPFEVTTTRRRFKANTILLATGATHRHLGVPGEKRLAGRGVSYCATCDGPLFKGKKVVVVGGGNSAVTEALHLHHIGVDVTLIHRRDKLRAQEFLAKNLIDNHIPVLWNTEIVEIKGKERVAEILLKNNQTNETEILNSDGVFLSIGYVPAVELAQKTGVELNADGYIKRDAFHRTSIPGIYSAGDVEGGFKQIVTAAGQGSEAAMAIFEDLMNPYWKERQAETTNA